MRVRPKSKSSSRCYNNNFKFQLSFRLCDDLRRPWQAGTQDRDLLRPDEELGHLLHQEHALHDVYHPQKDGARPEQGVLRTIWILRRIR